MGSLDSEQLVIGYANSRQSPIVAGMVFVWFFGGFFLFFILGGVGLIFFFGLDKINLN